MRAHAQDDAAKAKLAEVEAEVEAIKARVKAHDKQTEQLQHQLDERTTEAVAANKPLKVRVPHSPGLLGDPCLAKHCKATVLCDIPLSMHTYAALLVRAARSAAIESSFSLAARMTCQSAVSVDSLPHEQTCAHGSAL